ncbi:helix-turn-helix domain-containing protein [uncultured Methylobacterium sp.]|uniref:helix-turn-helix domain-containing protein n=1 Tax=uncultured Methylobacterium sp. TaxID=157278 RepID=UPI0026335B86|nr:helix-turn-helix domain-containing protein [uncultured Methylobacterium sp.]
MSFQALAWARSVKTGSPTLKAVLRAIAEYADMDGKAWPSQARLAEDTEFTVRGVRKAIVALEDLGLIFREEQRRKDGTQSTDIITLNFAWVDRRNEVPPDAEQAERGSSQAEPHSSPAERGSAPTTFEPPSNLHQEPGDSPAASAMPAPRPGENHLPADWWPDAQDRQAALDEGLAAEHLDHEAAQFRDRMLERGFTSHDWRASWRRWCRSPFRRGGPHDGGGSGRAPPAGRRRTTADHWVEHLRQDTEALTRIHDEQRGHDPAGWSPGGADAGRRPDAAEVRVRPPALVRLPPPSDPRRRRALR